MRRILLAGLIALLSATVLAACGSSDDDDRSTAASTSTAAAAEAAAFPVTIATKLGDVTIEQEPKRVVALDYPSADAAIALGVTPVGLYEVTYVEGGMQAWTKAALGSARPEMVNTDQGFPFERIAALKPDLILATNTWPLISKSYDELSAIAPVVGHVGAPGVDTWQQGVRQIARALGREAEGEQLVAEAEAKVARAAEDHPQLAGKTVSFFNYVPGDGLYVIDSDDDVSIRFLQQLGFRGLTAEVAALSGQDGRAKVSPERYDLLDAGVVIGTSPDPKELSKLERDKLFNSVPAVARGGFVALDIGTATAMAYPSVLSVPYAVDQTVAKLAAAVG